jgi:hypothetical protein
MRSMSDLRVSEVPLHVALGRCDDVIFKLGKETYNTVDEVEYTLSVRVDDPSLFEKYR